MAAAGNLVVVPTGDRPRRGTRGQRLTAAGKVERDHRIVVDRNRGFSWPAVAQRDGLGERQCRAIYAARRQEDAGELPGLDPMEWLFDEFQRLEQLLSDLAGVAERADSSSAQVGAYKAKLTVMLHECELLVAAGLLPRSLRAHIEHADVADLIRRFVELLEKHNADPAVAGDFLALLDERDRLSVERAALPRARTRVPARSIPR